MQERKTAIKLIVSSKFNWLNDSDIERAYNFALSDYLFYKYPSENNRPTPDELIITFEVEQWLAERMIDILDRAGGNLISYSENGMSWEYSTSNIDPSLVSRITPKAAVPR